MKISRRNFMALSALFPFFKRIPTAQVYGEDFIWGTFGKDGKSPFKWVRLGECSNEHLEAILRTQHQISDDYRKAINSILEYRNKNNIIIEDNISHSDLEPTLKELKCYIGGTPRWE